MSDLAPRRNPEPWTLNPEAPTRRAGHDCFHAVSVVTNLSGAPPRLYDTSIVALKHDYENESDDDCSRDDYEHEQALL